MNNAPAIFRALITYAVCVPLAIFVGYLVTNPLDYSSLATYGVLGFLFIFPLLMRWHYPLLVFSWAAPITLFFFKGSPSLWLALVVVSLGISIIERILIPNRHFISVPQMTRPSICLVAVVLLTAKLTGGIGLHTFGSEVGGGRKYLFLLIGILSYFAITAQPIPPGKAKWYVALFFLGQMTALVGDLYPFAPSFLHPIFWLFPSGVNMTDFQAGAVRMPGTGSACIGLCLWMLARYGVRGIFLEDKRWRPFLWIAGFMLIFLGGYRSAVFMVFVSFVIMFFMEGVHRTRFVLVLAFAGMLAAVAAVPLASHLPYSVQRALSFLPLNISLEAKNSADDSTAWRLKMWAALWPKVPQYLLLGKGLAITADDYQLMGSDVSIKSIDASEQGLALSGDYHNGILSVLIPFGLWGLIAYAWFMAAGLWVLYNNWKNGPPALQTVNMLMFGLCLMDFLLFASCKAGMWITLGIGYWAGHVGLSVALNNGVCRKKSPAVAAEHPVFKPSRMLSRLRPGLQQ